MPCVTVKPLGPWHLLRSLVLSVVAASSSVAALIPGKTLGKKTRSAIELVFVSASIGLGFNPTSTNSKNKISSRIGRIQKQKCAAPKAQVLASVGLCFNKNPQKHSQWFAFGFFPAFRNSSDPTSTLSQRKGEHPNHPSCGGGGSQPGGSASQGGGPPHQQQ